MNVSGLPGATDVFVVGAGPAGLAAAIAARRAGFEVIIADQAAPPIDKACGEGLMPDGVAALTQLGVASAQLPGRNFRGIRFLDGDLEAEATFARGHGLGIRRPDLHRALADHARDLGVVIGWKTTVDALDPTGVRVGDAVVRCRWIVGADGLQSRLRAWAGLGRNWSGRRRIGVRRRFRVRPWADFVEVHWNQRCQAYVTPVDEDEICVVIVGDAAHTQADDVARLFPALAPRLEDATPIGPLRGAITQSTRLKAVAQGQIALVGDASGSVDAVTGEGLSLAFRQAAALGAALKAGDLALYEGWHRRLAWRPRLMAHVLLLMGRQSGLRRLTLRGLAAAPHLFEHLLAAHVDGGPLAFEDLVNA